MSAYPLQQMSANPVQQAAADPCNSVLRYAARIATRAWKWQSCLQPADAQRLGWCWCRGSPPALIPRPCGHTVSYALVSFQDT